MHLLHTLLFAFITICTSTAIKKKFSIDFVTSQLPSCAQACVKATLATKPLRDDDLFGYCSGPDFGLAVASCNSKTCSNVDSQRIFALLAIYCAPIGGAFQTRFGPPPPDGFACINNCTTTALAVSRLVSGCEPDDISCQCKDPTLPNTFGTCISQRCSAEEIDETDAAGRADCVKFGGFGPYDINSIQAYLQYGLPDLLQPLPIINSSVLATPTGTRLPLHPTPPPRGGYGKKNKGREGGKGNGKGHKD